MFGKQKLLVLIGSLLVLVLLAMVYTVTREDCARAAFLQQLHDVAAIPDGMPVTAASARISLAQLLPVGSNAQAVLAYVAQKRSSCY